MSGLFVAYDTSKLVSSDEMSQSEYPKADPVEESSRESNDWSSELSINWVRVSVLGVLHLFVLLEQFVDSRLLTKSQ